MSKKMDPEAQLSEFYSHSMLTTVSTAKLPSKFNLLSILELLRGESPHYLTLCSYIAPIKLAYNFMKSLSGILLIKWYLYLKFYEEDINKSLTKYLALIFAAS